MRVAVEIVLSDDEIMNLSKLSKSHSTSVQLAERSRIVRFAGKSMTNEEIGEEPGITRQRAGRWRQRYVEYGIDGISQDASRPGRKPKISSRKVSQVIRRATQETSDSWLPMVERYPPSRPARKNTPIGCALLAAL